MPLVDPELRTLFRELLAGGVIWPLYLWGEPGRGKTSAAVALCDYCEHAIYRTVSQLIDAQTGRDVEPPWVWGGKSPHMAVLDELGERMATGVGVYEQIHSEVVKAWTDWRINTARSVGIYISNLSPDEFAKHYDGRIASRVLCGQWFHLKGLDRRM